MHEMEKRMPFPISEAVSNNLFDLIHIDIWGPTKFSMNGDQYFFNSR